jgi:hypothetical protein
MVIAAIILGLIMIGLIVLINFVHDSEHGDMSTGFMFGIVLCVCCVIEIQIVSAIIAEPKPKAMDVYQGKTTLEYTIRDGEVIDSVVVFKNSVYGK